ncbi:FAD-dependent monooxygenase [Actinomadura decatromicini]|uniref:NAD(P)-binding protein n=1 Tax=Actinomadura decatromicini TaxID=2604572 RepID=A0A5D3FSR0_9ACTN|nr:FAD-dependent monooxygenase [Actinomadura decatromicini]TYK51052.1 NAD(P)-binding protein [Actinomadura decatromicini]
MLGANIETPKIAILGGGIGGLAAAAFLGRAGLRSTVYEQAPALKEVGAGLVVAPNAARLLRRLGVLEPLLRGAVQLDVGWEFRRWQDGTVLSAEDLATDCERLYGEHTYTVHRAELLDAIRSAVPAESVRLGKRCTAIDLRGERPSLGFADGEVVEADIVIGADGVHSVVRDAIAGPRPAAFSGLCAFRALVPGDRAPSFARRRAQTLWIGPNHHLVHYPVSAGRFVNLVAFAPAGEDLAESWTARATIEEFLLEFDGWDPRLVDLIRAAGTPGRWALLDRAPLPRWSRGPVTLLGDAAHPMFPFFAQGAAQAIEDAAVLSRCLAEGLADPARALRRYEALRLPRTTRLQAVSHARSDVNHLPDGPEQRARDASFTEDDPLVANGWIYEYDPDLAMAAETTAG